MEETINKIKIIVAVIVEEYTNMPKEKQQEEKASIVLKSLEKGIPVKPEKIGEYIWLSDDNDLVVKRGKSFVKINMGITLKEFIDMCENFSNDDMLKIKANMCLNNL